MLSLAELVLGLTRSVVADWLVSEVAWLPAWLVLPLAVERNKLLQFAINPKLGYQELLDYYYQLFLSQFLLCSMEHNIVL